MTINTRISIDIEDELTALREIHDGLVRSLEDDEDIRMDNIEYYISELEDLINNMRKFIHNNECGDDYEL